MESKMKIAYVFRSWNNHDHDSLDVGVEDKAYFIMALWFPAQESFVLLTEMEI
jgi:hypothetical protein